MSSIPAEAAPAQRPALRVALFYATVFGTQGAASVYSGIWMENEGLTRSQIGAVNAAPVLALLVLNFWVGRVADRASDWRGVIVAGSLISGLASLLLIPAAGFWPILLAWTLVNAAGAAILPVIDAAAMRLARREGFDFPATRAWAVVGYTLMLIVTGVAIQLWGGWLFLPIFCACALARGLLALGLPRFRAPAEARPPPAGARELRQVLSPWFLLPLGGWSLVQSTHLVLGAFQGLLLAEEGYSALTIGWLIALGAASETTMFFVFRRVAARIDLRWLILASALVAAGRWACYGVSPGLPVLIALQLLHGLNYAMGFLACITYITERTDEDIAAQAQSLFTVMQQGFSAVALWAFGVLFGLYSAQAYFALAAVAGTGALVISLSFVGRLSRA